MNETVKKTAAPAGKSRRETKKTAQKRTDRKQTTFVIDSKTAAILDDLQVDLGASTRSQVLQKALILTKLAVDSAKESHVVTMYGDDENKKKSILLSS